MNFNTDTGEPLNLSSATDRVDSSGGSYILAGVCRSGEVPKNVTMEKPKGRTPCTRKHAPGETCGNQKGSRNRPSSSSSPTPSAVSSNASLQSMSKIVGDIEQKLVEPSHTEEERPQAQNSELFHQSTKNSIHSAGNIAEYNEHSHIDLEKENPSLYSKIKHLKELLELLEGEPEETHICHGGHSHSDSDTEQSTLAKALIIWGQVGELFSGTNGLFSFTLFLNTLYSFIPSNNPWLNENANKLEMSPAAIYSSLPFLAWMVAGAMYCHLLQEMNNENKERVKKALRAAISAAEHDGKDLTENTIEISTVTALLSFNLLESNQKRKLTDFKIFSEEALRDPELNLSFIQKIQQYWHQFWNKQEPTSKSTFKPSFLQQTWLNGDVLFHIVEYIGLILERLSSKLKEGPLLAVSGASGIIAGLASGAERATCKSAIESYNAFLQGVLIKGSNSDNQKSNLTTKLAVGLKMPEQFMASLYDYLGFGLSYPVAIAGSIVTSLASLATDYTINANSQQAAKSVTVENPLQSDIESNTPPAEDSLKISNSEGNSTVDIAIASPIANTDIESNQPSSDDEDNKEKNMAISWAGLLCLAGSAISVANERAAANILLIDKLCDLSPESKTIVSFVVFSLMLTTVTSFIAYNAYPNMMEKNRSLFFGGVLRTQVPKAPVEEKCINIGKWCGFGG